jgi:hypothetical protein
MSEDNNALAIWTVYRDPSDYPGKYVVRKSLVPGGITNEMFVADNLAEARALVPPGLYRLPRQRGDDSVIVECWL